MGSILLGGDNQSMGEAYERAKRILWPLPAVDVGIRWQCRCGCTLVVKYRAHFYCPHCSRRKQAPDTVFHGRDFTLRQAYEAGRPEK